MLMGGWSGGAAQGAFGGEVEAGAHDLPGGGEGGAGVIEEAGDAEVADLQGVVGVQQEVGGLDIPVDDALLVGGGESGCGLGGDAGHALGRQRAGGGKYAGEAVALDQLHYQEQPVVVCPEVQHADHVRVVEAPGGLGLQPETVGGGGIGVLRTASAVSARNGGRPVRSW
jgi:hypothetical protein